MKALYITNLGLTENLAKTQILAYICGLSGKGIDTTIMSYEKAQPLKNNAEISAMSKKLADSGIHWVHYPYHSRWGNIFDLISGYFRAASIIRERKIDVIHARASIPVLIAWPLAKIFRKKIIYDRRGTMSGDFVDDVNVKNVFSIRFFTKMLDAVDNFLMAHSDAVIVLSDRIRKIIVDRKGSIGRKAVIESIPCCTDLSLYHNAVNDASSEPGSSPDRFSLCYLGSLGTCYLLDDMIDFFLALRARVKHSFFYILSHTDVKFISDKFSGKNLKKGIDYEIISLKPDDVPAYLKKCTASLMFIKPVECKIGSSPTKFGESLGAGVPVIVNNGIGDTEYIIDARKVGVVVNGLTERDYANAIDSLLDLLKDGEVLKGRCRQAAKDFFSLEDGINKYLKVYDFLSKGNT